MVDREEQLRPHHTDEITDPVGDARRGAVDASGGAASSPSDDGAARRALDRLRIEDRATLRTWNPSDFIRSLRARRRESLPDTVRIALIVGAILLIALVVAVLVVRGGGSEVVDSVESADRSVAVATTTTTAPGVVVDVGGAVRSPGVYRLKLGSRVVDALEIAGGPAEDCDLEQVNLAALVVDGQRIWISRRGQAPPTATGADTRAPGASVALPIDLNTATLDQLDALPGVGPATARAIIDRRTAMGRFRSVDDLLTVKGIGEAKLETLRSSVVVR